MGRGLGRRASAPGFPGGPTLGRARPASQQAAGHYSLPDEARLPLENSDRVLLRPHLHPLRPCELQACTTSPCKAQRQGARLPQHLPPPRCWELPHCSTEGRTALPTALPYASQTGILFKAKPPLGTRAVQPMQSVSRVSRDFGETKPKASWPVHGGSGWAVRGACERVPGAHREANGAERKTYSRSGSCSRSSFPD